MPISVLKVGSYIIVKMDLSFKGFLKFQEIFKRDLNVASREIQLLLF
jgi:hypothetical protein